MIWTGVTALLIAISVFIFPEMKDEMSGVNEMFSSMGSFTAAFGMDRLNFGTLIGYYSMECGNTLGLGGAFFAALTAGGIISKEEKDKTAEFLLTQPVSRFRVITEKLVAVSIQIIALNLTVYAVSAGSIILIGENIPWKEFNLIHSAYFILQMELAGISFGISSFIRKGSAGIGIGIAAAMYFLNLISNITKSADFLKYITPFGYSDGADIITNGSLDGVLVAIGCLLGIAGIAAAYIKYTTKDIH